MSNQYSLINYEKRKNAEIFKTFREHEGFLFSSVQNYIPIYTKFFSLTPTNFNAVNLSSTYYLSSIDGRSQSSDNLFLCTVKDATDSSTYQKPVFFKFAPLLDPFKFLIGKYNIHDQSLFSLPQLLNSINTVHPKMLDPNNSSYIDSFFSFLSSKLIHNYKFVNGVDFYGSFLGVKKDYSIDIIDDIDYLTQSDFFLKQKNVAFKVDDYEFLLAGKPNGGRLSPIRIEQHNASDKSILSIESIKDDLYDDLFEPLTETNLKEHGIPDLLDLSDLSLVSEPNATTIRSGSTCSSRTSHTSDDDEDADDQAPEDSDGSYHSSATQSSSSSSSSCSFGSSGDQKVLVTIPKFPVNIICMEHCKNTFDDLIANNDLSQEEWFSAFMQIIMILITYQKCFCFTHNDLHTNNIMYVDTDKKHLYYCFNKKYYKVPTFGRIFKIIDFGRSIYKYNGTIFCSDSFQPGADAATQYNTEPYFNDKKARLEPNYSFDLCRLACSVFDYVIDDLEDVSSLEKCSPVVRLVHDWCLDDNGLNILYKNNGVERYPDFKLYKMIARCVHRHPPQEQLNRREFKRFLVPLKEISKPNLLRIINIDQMPSA
jgi:hypothetical protein